MWNYEYDDNDFLTKETFNCPTESYMYFLIHEYKENHVGIHEIKKSKYDENVSLISYTIYRGDFYYSGEKYYYNADDTSSGWTYLTYDKGKLIIEINYDSRGYEINGYGYEYDENGNNDVCISYDRFGFENGKTVYEWVELN